MSVIWVREKPGGKSGGQGENGYSSYHNEWTVKCNSPTATRSQVLGCGLLPIYGSPNIENLKAVCVKTDARRRDGAPCYWDASADWQESPKSGRNPADEQKQPDQRIPKWSSRFVPVPISRFVDYGGGGDDPKLLQDAALTPFDPVPDMPIWCEEITVFQYEATANRVADRAFLGATNTDSWQGAAAGEALVDDISTEMEYIQGIYWWPHTYRILIKPRVEITLPKGTKTYVGGFDPEYILNAGPMAYVQDKKTENWIKRPVTHGGCYDGRPAFLDKDGVEIPLDADGELTADPIFLKFHTKRQAAFSGLNLTPPPGWS